MIDILLISSSEDRSRRIVGLLGESGVAHRLRTLSGTAKQLRLHVEPIKTADLLIVDDIDLGASDLAGIEEAIGHGTGPNCMLVTPSMSKEMLMAAMRAGVRHVLSWPLDEREFADELRHVSGKKASTTRRNGRVVSFASCKGGSGTTFVAVNLAHTLATQRDKRVLLIDLNQQFADAGLLVADKTPPATLSDLCAQIDRLDAAFFDACVMHVELNLDVLAGAGDPVKAGELRAAHLERVFALVRSHYDVVIVDIGQSVNPVSIQALDQSDAICVVVRQNILYLHTARRLLNLLIALGYPASKVRLIVNQYDKNAPVSLQTLEETLGTKNAYPLPRDEKNVALALNQGVPLLALAKGSALAQGLAGLAEALWPSAHVPANSMLRRIFSTRPAAVRQLKTEN